MKNIDIITEDQLFVVAINLEKFQMIAMHYTMMLLIQPLISIKLIGGLLHPCWNLGFMQPLFKFWRLV